MEFIELYIIDNHYHNQKCKLGEQN